MTEAEAKMRWCPQARTARHGDDFAANRDRDGAPIYREHTCLGSACMAWRWNDPWTSAIEEGHGGDLVMRLKREPGKPKIGFCGLAGPPS